jgi:hypothetical protein
MPTPNTSILASHIISLLSVCTFFSSTKVPRGKLRDNSEQHARSFAGKEKILTRFVRCERDDDKNAHSIDGSIYIATGSKYLQARRSRTDPAVCCLKRTPC